MLSPYSRNCLRYYRPRDYKKYTAKKLVASFRDRKKYVCHYRNLKFYLEQGMQLGRIHRAIKFRQRPWLKKFVLCNTLKRKHATSRAGRDHHKKSTNSTFGKLCQQDRNHSTCLFAQNEETARRCLKSPVYKHWRIIGNRCVVFLGQKKMVRFNKPFIAGFTVLDLSKLHMYTVYYSQIKQRAPTAQVVLTDTDSLLLHVPDMPKSALMRTLKEGFDFSNYPPDHPLHSAHLKSIPGYMKDESAGKHVVEVGKMSLLASDDDDDDDNDNILLQVCALRAKCYVIRTADNVEDRKCKGVKRSIVARDFGVEVYRRALAEISPIRATSTRLGARDYKINLIRSRKIAMTSMQDKR
jgi:hypothetical protein